MENISIELSIGKGNFLEGFVVSLGWSKNGRKFEAYRDQKLENLPPAPELPNFYHRWSKTYRSLEKARWRKIDVPSAQKTNHASLNDCEAAGNALKRYLQEIWFSSRSFNSLAYAIRAEVDASSDDSVPIILDIHTGNDENDICLKKLPWHLWHELFGKLAGAEPVIGTSYSNITGNLSYPVSVLSIYGGDEGLNTSVHEQAWQKLEKQHNVKQRRPLIHPDGATLTARLRGKKEIGQKEPFQVLFFAGHSTSDESCKDSYIQYNKKNAVEITRLQPTLQEAVKNGLKLAIFNSCDGLGIANSLDGSRLPVAIVMREPIPDVVAQKFLQFFLEEFSERKSLYIAVRKARESLVACEVGDEAYPNAQWLPIICQNLSQSELVWPDKKRQIPTKLVGIATAVVGAVAATSIGAKIIESYWRPVTTPDLPISQGKLDDLPKFSSGTKRLFEQGNVDPGSNFEQGLQKYKQGDYRSASRFFRLALQENQNDPELLIYLNNAEAARKSGSRILVATAPINDAPADSGEVLRGVAQAQAEYNCTVEVIRAGIEDPGQDLSCSQNLPVTVVIADHEDKNDWARLQARLDELRTFPNVLGVVSRYNSSMTFRAEKFLNQLEQLRIPIISTTSTAIRDTDNVHSDYVFRLPSGDAEAAERLVNYLQNQNSDDNVIDNVVVVYDPDEAYSNSIAQKTALEIEDKFSLNPLECKESQISQCLQKLDDEPVDAVFLFPPDDKGKFDNAIQFVNEFKDNRANDNPIFLGGDTLYSYEDILRRWPNRLKSRLVVAVPWEVPNEQSTDENILEFIQSAETLWGNVKVNWRTALAFDATNLFINAISTPECNKILESVETVEACRESVKTELEDGSRDSLTGQILFDQRGDRTDADWMLVRPNDNGSRYELF